MPLTPFHIAIQVRDIDEAREFYGVKMGLSEGRSMDTWIDFNLFGHQIVAHLVTHIQTPETSPVDGEQVPAMHFGVILEWEHWHQLSDKLRKKNMEFVIEPHVRYSGKPGEHATMFFKDPSGNHLEFKSFYLDSGIFAKQE